MEQGRARTGRMLVPSAVENLTVDVDAMNEDMHATRAIRANLVNVITRRAVGKARRRSLTGCLNFTRDDTWQRSNSR